MINNADESFNGTLFFFHIPLSRFTTAVFWGFQPVLYGLVPLPSVLVLVHWASQEEKKGYNLTKGSEIKMVQLTHSN